MAPPTPPDPDDPTSTPERPGRASDAEPSVVSDDLADSVADLLPRLATGRRTHDVFAEIQRAIGAAIHAPSFALLLADAEGTRFLPQLLAIDGVMTRGRALPPVAIDDALPAARAWREGHAVRAADPAFGWAALVLGDRPRRTPRSELAAPILHGREPLGVLVLQSPEADAFTAADADLLTLIGRQAGIVIENARLIDAERHEHAIAEAAMRMARVALSAPSLADAAGAILSTLDAVVPSAGKSLAVAEDPSATASVTGAMRVVGTSGAPTGANAIVIPLTARDRMIGILAVTADTGGRSLAAEARDTLHRLSATVALAVDAQLLAEGERRRRAREGMLATALATMDHPVFILSREHTVLYANAAALREYGWTAEELVGRGADALTASPFPTAHEEPETDAARALASVGVELIEQVHRRRDGTQFPVAVALSPIRETGGVAVGWVLSVRNVTDERRIAEQLRQSEKLAALGELVAGVAHELNNPLAGISAFAQLMMEEDLPPDQHESVRLIKREADRAVSVIRDLLVFSRKSGPAIGPVDPNGLVQLSLRLRGYALRSAGVDVQIELDPDVPVVQGDDQKLQQVLLNLLVNAEYAMRGSSAKRLVLRTSHGRDPRLGDSVTIEVSDSGMGMTAETRARIFEPFFTTKPPGVGTGLGLSVSYGIIEAHGGAIVVESELGHGTSFRITLPVRYGGTAANGRTQRSA